MPQVRAILRTVTIDTFNSPGEPLTFYPDHPPQLAAPPPMCHHRFRSLTVPQTSTHTIVVPPFARCHRAGSAFPCILLPAVNSMDCTPQCGRHPRVITLPVKFGALPPGFLVASSCPTSRLAVPILLSITRPISRTVADYHSRPPSRELQLPSRPSASPRLTIIAIAQLTYSSDEFRQSRPARKPSTLVAQAFLHKFETLLIRASRRQL